MYYRLGGSQHSGLGIIFGWIGFVLLVVIAYLLVRLLIDHGAFHLKPGEKAKTPLEIAEERYAKGEIDKKEFDQIKKDVA